MQHSFVVQEMGNKYWAGHFFIFFLLCSSVVMTLVSDLLAALRSKEKIETQCYKFKTKYGSHVSLQSQWFSFTNPWTKEVEFIVSLNRVIS